MATIYKKKKFHYVLVLTNEGPVFVTNVDYSTKYAAFDKLEKPRLFPSAEIAEDLALGLNLNLITAMHVVMPFEFSRQPYYYETGHFKWEESKNDNQ